MLKILFALCLSSTSLFADNAKELLDFVSDGCTMSPDGTLSKPGLWRHCCFEHDLRYWFGGTIGDRDFADVHLRSCVRDAAGEFWAAVIYRGVRLGHYSPV